MKWLALISLIAANLVRLPAPVVRVSSGLVRGRVSENGKFYEYFGIPYGIVDERNRFQAPLPPPQWDGIFPALNENIWCPQKTVANIVLGEPNCLKLNVYSPVHAPYKLLPVMVFIHGGCFITGTGSPFLYGGDFFAEHEVVFVALNYRLNVEGFLCLGIKEAPGNAGLKDQIAALKWIRKNIKSFGGDPDNVTLFGESAGAVSTSFMILSPAAKGLFHKAILQSGSSLAPWALQHDPIKTASELVKKFGYNTKNPHEIHRILSMKSAKELNNAFDYSEKNKFCVADEHIFVPCIENHIDGIEPIITEYPADVIRSGNYTKVPMIIGFNDNEGYYFVATDYGTSLKNDSNLDLTRPLQPDLEFPTEYDKNTTTERIRRQYFSSSEEEVIMNMVDLYSDLHFKFPLVLESELYAKTTDKPLYFYLFRYSGYINMPKIISGFGLSGGASHADDLFYMFKPHSFPLPHRYLETDMIKRMVTLWTNFAKYSDPTPNTTRLLPIRWYPSHEMNPTGLAIGDDITTTSMWDHVSVGLWNDTYNKYRKKNYGFKHYRPFSKTDTMAIKLRPT